jgi:hypothetical protein
MEESLMSAVIDKRDPQFNKNKQGEIMRKSFLTVVFTLTCLLGMGISAHAQDLDKIAANVPFDFVAGGETLPAGTYSVSRVSSEGPRSLVMRSDNNSVFLLPMFFDGDPAVGNGASADHAELSFEHVGNKYFLSKVETLEGVYAFRTPRAMTQVAQMKDHGTASSSGAN